jgi:serine phosphatase RsbU (regulator of sigma subunit)
MGVAILTCSGALMALSVSVFVNDKGHYFMDYNLNQVHSLVESLDHQIRASLSLARIIHIHARNSDKKAIEHLYDEGIDSLKLRKLLVLNVSKSGLLKPFVTFGDLDNTLLHVLDQQGWDSFRFLNDSVLIAKVSSGNLAIGTLVRSSDGGGTAVVSILSPKITLPDNSKLFQIYLVDSLGDSLLSSGGASSLRRSEIVELLKPVLDEKIASGVRKWKSDGKDYLAAYQRSNYKELSVLSLVAEKEVFLAIRGLFFRSIVLGLSIALIAIGLALLFIKKVTEGLRAMEVVTQKVREGVFSYRVDTRSMGNDEVGALAASFNLMSGRIDELMIESANRVENKYETEMLSSIQSQLLSKSPLKLSKFNFFGKTLLSRKFGGDWWHYEAVGDYVILAFGKTESRGIRAAMILSAAQAALATYQSMIKLTPTEAPQLKYLVTHLNSAIYEVGKGKEQMTCFLALIDTQTGLMEMVNCSHPLPYLQRFELEVKPKNISERFEAIRLKKYSPLGAHSTCRVDPDSIQLQPSDMIFWYTPGLLKALNPHGETLSSEDVFGMFAHAYDQNEGQAEEISESAIRKASDFLGEVSKNPSDDITVAVAIVPKKARFVERDDIA